MSRSSPCSPRERNSGLVLEEASPMLRVSSKRTLAEELHLRTRRSLEAMPGLAALLTGEVKLSARAAVGVGLALCVLAMWLGTGTWQAKCCMCAKVAHLPQDAGPLHKEASLRHFVFVYDLGTKYTEGVQHLEPWWYSEKYDVERRVIELLLGSNAVRTTDPEEASLFFVPFYSARYTLFNFRESEANMGKAVRNTSQVWENILHQVRNEYPFFNRSRGRDHFGILALDQGRCSALTFVRPSLYGEMFFLMFHGDRVTRSTQVHPKLNLQFLSYSYERTTASKADSSTPDIPCYMPGRDIVIPPLVRLPLVSPLAPPRTLPVFLELDGKRARGIVLAHHGHDVAKELLNLFQGIQGEGWEVGEQEHPEAVDDLRRAVFCIDPPGLAQWSSALSRSILSGCIPVTFFRDNDNPWQDDIDYSSFSVNIDPDDLGTLRPLLQALLSSANKVQQMQKALLLVQSYFLWSDSSGQRAEDLLLKRLERRALEGKQRRVHEVEQALLLSGKVGETGTS